MINHFRFIWQLLVLASLLIILGILMIPRLGIELSMNGYVITIVSVTVINLIAWFIMVQGITKSNRDGMVVLLAGIGSKFLLYLLYILVYWLVTKILTKPFILTFFALYLVFTFLLAGHLFKLLKNK
jgi:hypothetical protein